MFLTKVHEVLYQENEMYLYANTSRFERQQSIRGNNNQDKDTTTSKRWETVSSTSSTSIQFNERHTAEYLWHQVRPPFEEGMQLVNDPLLQCFFEGQIPDDHAQQGKVAQSCIDYGFASSLAWLFAKTKATEFIYRGSNHGFGFATLARTLQCPGLSLSSLIIETQYFNTHDLAEINAAIETSDSITTVNFSNTVIAQFTFGFIKEMKGRNGELVVTGGIVKVEPATDSSLSATEKLPAAVFGPDWISAVSRAQLIIQGRNAISAIERTRQFDIKNLSEVRLPDISGFSEDVQKALRCFFQQAYAMQYFMLHTTFPINMNSILSSGRLTSRHRLEAFSGKDISSGLKDKHDVANEEHRMIFAAMGTNADNIRPPSSFETVKHYHGLSSILIDVDLFIQNNLSKREHMIVKSCDWGEILETTDKKEPVKQIISIPNTSISIIRLDMDGRTGAIQPDHVIKYK